MYKHVGRQEYLWLEVQLFHLGVIVLLVSALAAGSEVHVIISLPVAVELPWSKPISTQVFGAVPGTS